MKNPFFSKKRSRSKVSLDDARLIQTARLQSKDELERIRTLFDVEFYLASNPDVAKSGIDPLEHFLSSGGAEGREPRRDFDSKYYRARYGSELLPDEVPFLHFVLKGRTAGYSTNGIASKSANVSLSDEAATLRPHFDEQFYLKQNTDVAEAGIDPVQHYCEAGWLEGRDPSPGFSTVFYLETYPDVQVLGSNPFLHYVQFGRAEGRRATPASSQAAKVTASASQPLLQDLPAGVDPFEYDTVASALDVDFYKEQCGGELGNDDAVAHFLLSGHGKFFDPSPDFSVKYYLRSNPDVEQAGVNSFVHWLTQGKTEGRLGKASTAGVGQLSGIASVASEHAVFANPSPKFEEFDPTIVRRRAPAVKALAFYLPQFHAIPENDAWWGTGFTEWRNVGRGLPRYRGHFQPRIPRDLGFYDLSDVEVMRRQTDLARAAGIHGFNFYYYSFNGERLLEKPLDNYLNEPSIDFPFCLTWANENWTRTWDGFNKDVLKAQDYLEEHDEAFIDDLARHFRDRRYIHVGDRPLFMIYRPGLIPDSTTTIQRWRDMFRERHGMNPLILMAQGFDDHDPYVHGLDGAMEFPPHKVAAGLPAINNSLQILDQEFSGHVIDYAQVVDQALSEDTPPYPLVKGVTTTWDNDARRPGRGMVLQGGDPAAYEEWLRAVVDFSLSYPLHDESFVVINAWNEWCEGAYLEPDVHFGSAYLNATARAVTQSPRKADIAKRRFVVVSHDAYRHGAQILALNIGRTLKRRFGCDVEFLVLGEGPMLSEYGAVAPCTYVDANDVDRVAEVLDGLKRRGFAQAICNTSVSGKIAEDLADAGIRFISLVHEMPRILKEFELDRSAKAIAQNAEAIVFPAPVVRDGFLELCEEIDVSADIVMRTQGLYMASVRPREDHDLSELREKYGIPADAKIVINVGYADLRKGFDIFELASREMAKRRDDVYFVWVGALSPELDHWLRPDIEARAENRLILTGQLKEVADIYALADAMLLTSREDPFPSVVIESYRAGVPVVGFVGSGGCEKIIEEHGRLVDRLDVDEMLDALEHFIDMPDDERQAQAEARQELVLNEFRFDNYVFDLMKLLEPTLQSVSVVLPNYNYEDHLDERLTSIFRQTYPVLEVIVLDDKSPDESVRVIRHVAGREERDVVLVENEENSGSVFKQWRKGLELACGDYVWIAEADDVADERFLQLLVEPMAAHDAGLGFSDSWQIDEVGTRIGETYKPYINQTLASAFDVSFVKTGHDFLRDHLSIKNVILNVSSVVWRTEVAAAVVEEVGEELFDFKVAGDWRLYTEVCRQGHAIVYEKSPLNGHRRHATSVTHSLKRDKHFSEIEEMQRLAEVVVDIDHNLREKQVAHLKEVRRHLGFDDVIS